MKKRIKSIGIIGAGNMGQALMKGLKGTRFKRSILIFEKDKKKSRTLTRKLRVKEAKDLKALLTNSNVVIICIKPQDIDGLLRLMKSYELSDKLIISIAAGVTTSYILRKLKGKVAIARVMPNINAFVQESVNAICLGKYTQKEDLNLVRGIFSKLGENFIVSESKMDVITALSGSGPAYVALFIKALLSAAKKNGLKDDEARRIINQTLKGTLKMLEEYKMSSSDFIKRVKSKGGTTEAAFKVFDKKKFESIMQEAVSKAKKRSGELGKK